MNYHIIGTAIVLWMVHEDGEVGEQTECSDILPVYSGFGAHLLSGRGGNKRVQRGLADHPWL